MLPRRKCRYIDDIEAMNTSVQRLNSAIAAELVKAGGGYIKYQEIIPNDESLFDSDGVTCLTKEMGSSWKQFCSHKAIKRNGILVYPDLY